MSIQPTDMDPTDRQPSKSSERDQRQLNLWACVFLLPLVLAEQTYDSARALLAEKAVLAQDVRWEDSANFGGSEWRFVGMQVLQEIPGRPNSVAVVVNLRVTIQTADLENAWRSCTVMLVDGQGHRWLPSSSLTVPTISDAKNCNSAMFSQISNGQSLGIVETFLVPRSVTNLVIPALDIASERPYFLRFEVRNSQ